jgi:adenosylcobinamide kinase/adenosylcobinamide-phosphate guanylyltransferase
MLILVTGGSRSGKSSYALGLASKLQGPHTYIATAQPIDEEMRERIASHRAARPAEWGLIEEPLQVPDALRNALTTARTVVLDCVTLWMSNLLLADERFDERRAEAGAGELLQSAGAFPGAATIVVTNEVGSGVVPETVLGRRFRDCAGRANEVIARGADEE